MNSSRTAAAMAAAAIGFLFMAFALLGSSGCTTATVGAGWGVSVSDGPYGPYGPYGQPVGPVIGVGLYGRP
jgi:hypothetical protein